MKAGLGLRLEGFFLVFGIEADYRVARARATLILTKRKKIFARRPGEPPVRPRRLASHHQLHPGWSDLVFPLVALRH